MNKPVAFGLKHLLAISIFIERKKKLKSAEAFSIKHLANF